MMKKHIFICIIRISTLLTVANINQLKAETTEEKPIYSIMQTISYPFNYSISASAKNSFFELHTNAKLENAPSKFIILPEGFNLRFSPLLYYKNKKLYPVLSFFYGGITKTSFLNHMAFKENFEKRIFYKGIIPIPTYFINISKNKFDANFGGEFALYNINIVFLSEQYQKSIWPNLFLCTTYKKEFEAKFFNIILYSSLTNSSYSQFNLKNPLYDQFYSVKFILTEEKDLFDSTFLMGGGLSIPHKRQSIKTKNSQIISDNKLKFFGKAEYNLKSDYFVFNTGIFLKQDLIKIFIQPKFSFRLLDIAGVYNFSFKSPKKEKMTLNFHSGGIGINLALSNFKLNSEIYYEDKIWELKGGIKIPINLFFNSSLTFNGNGKFESKLKNPFIIKSFHFSSNIQIKFNKNFNLHLLMSFSRKNKPKKNKGIEYIIWEKGEFNFSASAEFKKQTKRILNSFKTEIKLQTLNPFIKANFTYKITF